MKKYLLPILLASIVPASATTINFTDDSPGFIGFDISWGSKIADWGTTATGADGSTVQWLCQISRNQNFYFVEIHDADLPDLRGFSVRFWTDPEYYGPVPTAFGSPNITFSAPADMTILPLEGNPYGARFVYGAPDGGGGVALLALGLAGIAFGRWMEGRP